MTLNYTGRPRQVPARMPTTAAVPPSPGPLPPPGNLAGVERTTTKNGMYNGILPTRSECFDVTRFTGRRLNPVKHKWVFQGGVAVESGGSHEVHEEWKPASQMSGGSFRQ
jgi:hypothetical protein